MSLTPFITKFDVLEGNTIVYPSNPPPSLKNLAFQAIPSGLHTSSFDVVRFLIDSRHGICVYRQNGLNMENAERAQIRMYSVGVIYSDLLPKDLSTLLNCLDARVSSFVDSEKPELELVGGILSDVDAFKNGTLKPEKFSPVFDTEVYMRDFCHSGPLFYPLWRLMLANKRVLISNHFPRGPPTDGLVNLNTSLLYTLQDLTAGIKGPVSKVLGNVTLSDMEVLKRHAKEKTGFFACTSDEIFFPKTQLFDYLLEFDSVANKPVLRAVRNGGLEEVRFSKHDLIDFVRLQTGADFERFQAMYSEWISQADRSWAAFFGECVYGIPRSFFALEDATPNFEADSFKEHFQKIWSHYKSTLEDIIRNSDEEYSLSKASADTWSELDDIQGTETSETPEVELTLSDIHQLYFNPFSAKDRNFVVELGEVHFGRHLVSPQPFGGIFSFFC